jgi:DNA polymerase-1
VSVYQVFTDEDLPPAPMPGPVAPIPDPEPEPTPPPPPVEPDSEVSTPEEDLVAAMTETPVKKGGMVWGDKLAPAAPVEPTDGAEVVTFDLETHDAEQLHRHGPNFVRIGATAADSEEVVTYDGPGSTVPRQVAADIRTGEVVTGHNIMAFDLPALVNEGAMTMTEVHDLAAEGRLADALLMARFIDPPMAKEKGVDEKRKYDLGSLGAKLGLGEKLTEVSHPLAKKYGGWGEIPIDPTEDGERGRDAADFIGYMAQDVELSRKLYRVLLAELGGTMPDYLVREHRVAAIGAQLGVNGFLVDQTLLSERVHEVEETKRKAMAYLHGVHGVPLADAKGVPYKSPLASKVGKEAVGAALVALGVPERVLWRTPKSQDLQLSSDAMIFYGREYGQNRPELRKLCTAVYRIVSARSVYQTALDHTGPDGRVHPKVSFEQATGRWSVTRPGLTVFGKRNGRHVERAVFLPDPGEVLISADLSQVDMRAVAALSQDPAYMKMLESEDPHAEIARLLFGDPGMREVAKPIGHGWNYGRGVKAISQANNLDPAIVQKFDTSMYERFPRLVAWQGEVRALAESGQLLDNGWGRMMRADPHRAHTQGPALMGQGAARDIMMHGLLRMDRRLLPMLRAQVHDEIVLSVPAAEAEEIGRAVVDALSFNWRGVDITADVSKTGTDWSKCYEK